MGLGRIRKRIMAIGTSIASGPVGIEPSEQPPMKRMLYSAARVATLFAIGFKRDQLPLRASALTFYSLLSIVPVLAMAFGIAKGFGLAETLEQQVLDGFSGQMEVVSQGFEFANNLLESTRGDVIAGVGAIILLFAVVRLLSNVEGSFNAIWQVREHRTVIRKLTDFLAITLLGPLLLIIANSLTVLVNQKLAELADAFQAVGVVELLVYWLLRLTPYMVSWLMFTLTYLILPNTKVRLGPALIAGILAGTTFYMMEWLLISFGIGVAKFNAVYGGFAAFPLFLIWLQLSWLIVLSGAELSYSIQHAGRIGLNDDSDHDSIATKKRLALAICLLVIRRFRAGEPALAFSEISDQLRCSRALVANVIATLIAGRILSEVKTDSEEPAYQPAQDTDRLDASMVLSAVEQDGASLSSTQHGEIVVLSDNVLAQLEIAMRSSPDNRRLKDILEIAS